MQQQAKAEIRQHFRAKKALASPAEVDEAVKAAEEAADYLRTSVIQAKRVKGDHFGQQLSASPLHPLCFSSPALTDAVAFLLLSSSCSLLLL